jgi:hypothetical protein
MTDADTVTATEMTVKMKQGTAGEGKRKQSAPHAQCGTVNATAKQIQDGRW